MKITRLQFLGLMALTVSAPSILRADPVNQSTAASIYEHTASIQREIKAIKSPASTEFSIELQKECSAILQIISPIKWLNPERVSLLNALQSFKDAIQMRDAKSVQKSVRGVREISLAIASKVASKSFDGRVLDHSAKQLLPTKI